MIFNKLDAGTSKNIEIKRKQTSYRIIYLGIIIALKRVKDGGFLIIFQIISNFKEVLLGRSIIIRQRGDGFFPSSGKNF